MITYDRDEMKVQIESFLKNHDLAVVSTVAHDKKPEAATVGYLYENDIFYFITRANSRKAQNLEHNQRIAAVIGTTAGPNTVQLEGEAFVLKSGTREFNDLLVKFAGLKVLYYGPFLKMEGIDFVIVTVKVDWLRWLDVNDLTNKEEFYQLFPEDQSSQ
jgi:uncharacterized pyridoxamine 5'-phosphate oxidase family protein